MLSIRHLLNPEQTDKTVEVISTATRPYSAPIQPTSMAAGNQVSFPPFAILSTRHGAVSPQSIELAQYHDHFQVALRDGISGKISDTSRRIPYSSDKRDFLARTGRDAFEVYEYEFRLPEDRSKAYPVMWDYQNGLVRITPFFKACHFSKTTPKKALEANGVLQTELSHSVTGGAVGAQGYWTPYACARALCLTFCYPIRWALTPIFGPSFVDECLSPNDPGFGRFKIDPRLIEEAQVEAAEWKKSAGQYRSMGASLRAGTATLHTAVTKKRNAKQLRLRAKAPSRSAVQDDLDDDLDYGLDSPPISPKTIPTKSKGNIHSNTWTAVNDPSGSETPEKSSLSPYASPIPPLTLPAPIVPQSKVTSKDILKSARKVKRKAKHTPTSYPDATTWADDREDSDDAYYGAISDYIVRSPPSSASGATPPAKRVKQPKSQPEEFDQQPHGYDSQPETPARTLDQAEMIAVSGLLKLLSDDSQASVGID